MMLCRKVCTAASILLPALPLHLHIGSCTIRAKRPSPVKGTELSSYIDVTSGVRTNK